MLSKKAQRAAILKHLKNDLTPLYRKEQSALLCAKVLARVKELGAANGAQASPKSSSSSSSPSLSSLLQCPRTTVHLCSFLPMYFEPDLVDVFAELWRGDGEATPATAGYRMYVPRMVPPTPAPAPTGANDGCAPAATAQPNIMHFVEVLSAEDLKESFVPQGRFNIVEIREDVWSRDCCNSSPSPSSPAQQQQQQQRAVLGHYPPSKAPFEECLVPSPPNCSSSPPNDHHHAIIMLCPSTAFDAQCGRIGKGAGYYDRFLEATYAALSSSSPSSALSFSLTTIGVGFDEQMIDAVLMESNDIFMDEVITPSHYHVRREGVARE